MSITELQAVWRNHLGGSPVEGLPKFLLARLLAYRLQVQQFGDLPKKAVGLLDRVAVDLDQGRQPKIPYPDERRLKPGSVLIREYEGVQQRVMVLEEGYAWNGKIFASLSAVAKAITGTHWNGQRFFGLDRKDERAVP
ncbi:DUF2924 domain-containing protein [Nordella sp. HKS 07]|nr:DUF2924 domain-containing protein [Nordella sp. HKS 07]